MKISYNWLKEYVKIDLTPEKVCEILTDTGLEVEGLHKIESVKGGLKGVVVGEVLTCTKHPDADRLNVTTVNVGEKEPLQIVCGAPNVAVGQKVIVATVGSILYPNPEEPFKIKKSKIRGVESFGMICAEDELGIGESHDGILVLENDVEVGLPAATYFELEDDYEIEIGLTPNRADAMGHVGVARDLVAYLNVHENANLSLNLPSIEDFKVENNDLIINVSVENEDLCPRYMGTTIKGVKIQASPAWLQKRLRAIGLSPINNVVDATNFVMHELGTPLHAFDADKLNGNIVVKTSNENDEFTTLDEVRRKLSNDNLMITNGEDNLCIAGVFGGLDSGVSQNSTNIFLESAYFNPVSVRKTAKFHALNTDSSFRFERGVDPNMTEYALKRTALLIQEIAGGSIAMDVVDTNPQLAKKWMVDFDFNRCNKLIGHHLPKEMVEDILVNLDIDIIEEKGSTAKLAIPTYRVDVTREADVIEEVLRIYGFNKVPIPEKLNSSISYFEKPDKEKVQNVISEMLVGLGFTETLNNSLTKSAYINKLAEGVFSNENSVKMLNPLSQDLDVMRQSMVFNALEMVAHNQNRQNADLKLYEFGKTYFKYDSGYEENKRLMILVTGKKESENWNSSKADNSFYTIKGIVIAVLKRLGLNSLLKEKALKKSLFQDGVQLYVLKNKIGEIGWATSKMKKYFGIKSDVFIADLDWDVILDALKFSKIKYTELPKTFAVRRDFSLLLNNEVKFSEIENIARNCDKKILKEIGLFDVYEGKNLPDGKKSYAVSFKFQDAEKTLKDQQVDAIMDKIRKQLEEKLAVELR